jgi:hypothetical protein
MKIKFLLGVVSLLALCSCQRVVTEQECAATRLTTSYSKELEEKNIYLINGTGLISDKIDCLTLVYRTDGRFNIEEVRKLYMEALEGYITKANSCDEIQPFLRDNLFTHKNIELAIAFLDKYGKAVPSPYISGVFLAKGNVYYKTGDYEKKTSDFVHKETYEEAFEIVYGGK